MKLKWNRKCSIFVLFMFITVTFASFNTNLFIDGRAYVRADDSVRITNIELVDTELDGYETIEPEFTSDTVTMDANLPKQNSSVTYRVTIQNNSDYDHDITSILEDTYTNSNVSYQIVGVQQDTLLAKHTTTTFTIKFTNNVTIQEEEDIYRTETFTFNYTGDVQEFVVPYDGEYTIELWGAAGGYGRKNWNTIMAGGLGGYTSGTINLKKNKVLYVYVGGAGLNGGDASQFVGGAAGWNGGGKGGNDSNKDAEPEPAGGGGGATDIRLVGGNWNNFSSLMSRIMVAGGASGGTFYHKGEPGGTLTTQAYKFGQGQPGVAKASGTSGAGGGYLGGTNNTESAGGIGYGGSSYISGHNGCQTINPTSTEENLIFDNNCEYSNIYKFTNTVMIDGAGYSYTPDKSENPVGMPTFDGTSTMTGNNTNGYVKITVTRKVQEGNEYSYKYTGNEQTFTAPYTGIYKLETWGAQGGSYNNTYYGGYGGYSKGNINLNKNDTLYINVGGAGAKYSDASVLHEGGYNGGGDGESSQTGAVAIGTGGGATHIATTTGLLSTLSSSIDQILIVSGGGGGSTYYYGSGGDNYYGIGGAAGGYIGNSGIQVSKAGNYTLSGVPTGGTQTTGGQPITSSNNSGSDTSVAGSFGLGGGVNAIRTNGGGGGFYGGASGIRIGGAGGSGYIGNSLLTDKVMYCFNCQESQSISTRTVSTTSHSYLPEQNTAKEGNGYSKITLEKRIVNNTKLKLKFTFERHLYDYTITYDENYLENDTFKTTYNTSFAQIRRCCNAESPDGFPITGTIDSNGYYVRAEKYLDCEDPATGIYFLNRNLLDTSEEYTTMFEVKGNSIFDFLPGSEQQSGLKTYASNKKTTSTEWKQYRYDFTTTETVSYKAFIFYTWAITGYNRVLEIRNPQIEKKHEYNYVTKTATETQPIGSENILSAPFRDGWTFLGWFDDPIGGNQVTSSTIMPSGNTTYYAHWSHNNYNIEYDLDGGTESSLPNSYYTENSDISVPNPTKSGYEFTGWTGGKNLIDVNNLSTLAKSRDISVDATGLVSDSTPTTDSRSWGYSASNWFVYLESGTYTMTMFFEKEITQSVNSGIYVYDENGNHLIVNTNIHHKDLYTYTFTLSAAKKIGIMIKAYDGEYRIQLEKGNSYTSYEQNITTPEMNISLPYRRTGNRKYTANWETNTPKVTLNPNGGEVSSNSVTVSYGNHYSELPTPTRTGYTFAGWKLIPNELTSTEYIETNREGYINTGYYANDNTEYEISAQLLEGEAKDASLFGSRTGAGQSDAYVLWHNNIRGDHAECISPVFAGQQRGSSDDVEYETFIKHTMELRNKKFYIDGVEKYTFTATFPETNNYPLYLFGLNNGGTVDGRKYRGKLYYFQLIENGSTVRYYVPVVRKSDNKKGVYDLVNGRFFTISNAYEDYSTRTITNNSTVDLKVDHTLIATWVKNSN